MLALNSGHTIGDVTAPRLVWVAAAELTIQPVWYVWPFHSGLLVSVWTWLFADQPKLTHQAANLEASNHNAFLIKHGGDHTASC